MTGRTRYSAPYAARSSLLFALACAFGCAGDPTSSVRPGAAQRDAVKFWEVLQSTTWNARATSLLAQRPPANGQAAASRILTYVSLAQYRAVLAAEGGKAGPMHPSIAAAVGAASAAVLSSFFQLDTAMIWGLYAADVAAPQWPGAKNQDLAAGEAIGKQIGKAVVAQAASDNYAAAVSVGTPLAGPGHWTSNGTAIVRSLWGTKPFFLTSVSQLRAPAPPVYGSSEFLAALAEVRAISDTRTPEQLAIANKWNTGFTASQVNLIADELIIAAHRTEGEAARILAFANAATFDAQIACWDSKLTYWFIRPPQADPQIKTAFAMPNHPSYPSAHSCITSAMLTVLMDAFPNERSRLQARVEEAGFSRVFAGIHYRFDVEAGQNIGAAVAAIALRGSLE